MEEEKERLIAEGNSFYEIDLDCLKRRKRKEDPPGKPVIEKKNQRNTEQ